MVNYSEGKIYKIVSDLTDEMYIGSTTEKYLSSRLNGHKYQYRLGINNTKSGDILKYPDARIVLIENFGCSTQNGLEAREYFQIKEHIKQNINVVNKHMPTRTQKEYYEDNKEAILSKCIEYRATHKDQLKEYWKNYRETHKEVKAARDQAYRENNRDDVLEKKREYEQRPWTCDVCNQSMKLGSRNKHLKSTRHINKVNIR